MAKRLRKGDRVSWKSHGGKAVGKVERKLTSTTKVKGHTAKATEDDPQYLVETDDGTRAAHKPSALTRLTGAKGRKDGGGKGDASGSSREGRKARKQKGKGKKDEEDKGKKRRKDAKGGSKKGGTRS